MLKPKDQKLIKIEAPFLDKISGLPIIKLLDKSTQSIIMLKVKFMQNVLMLDMANSSSKILILILYNTISALPEVNGAKKMLDMNMLPEKQKIAPQNKSIDENKPRLGQGRAGIRCKRHQPVDGIMHQQVNHTKYPRYLLVKMLLNITWISLYRNN